MIHRLLAPLLVLLFAACNVQYGTPAGAKDKQKKKAKQGDEVIPVRTTPLRVGSISRNLSGSGTLRGKAEVEVLTEAAGLVVELLADKGRRVERGDVLARLDDRLARVELENAKIGLGEAKAKLAKSRYALEEQQHVIARTRLKLQDAGVAEKKAQLAFSESKRALASKQKLPRGSLSVDELEKAQLARDQAQQEVARARLTIEQSALDLKSAELKRGDLGRDQRDAERQVTKAELALQKARIEFGQRLVRAPIGGLVYDRELELGQRIAAAAVVFRIADTSAFHLDLRLPEAELGLLGVGQRCQVSSPLLFTPVSGRLAQLDPAIDPKTGTVGARLRVPDGGGAQAGLLGWIPADFLLRRGMFVRARIEVRTHPRAKLVPHEAVVYEDQQAYVYTVGGGKARRVAVRIGFAREQQVEIKSPALEEGAPIVVVGQRTVKDGTPVRVIQ